MRGLVARVDEDVRDRLYQVAAEARFGYRQALNASDDNEAARVGLREAIETMVRFELERGTPEAAAAALAELESPPPELAARVREALATRAAERERVARLEKLEADLDPQTGRRTRMAVLMILGAVWTISPLAIGSLYAGHAGYPREHIYWWPLGILFIGALVVFWGRESLMKTALNRMIVSVGMVMFATQFVLEIGANLANLPIPVIATLHIVVWLFALGILCAFIEPKLLPSSFAMMVAFLYACAKPEHVWTTLAAVNLFLALNFGVAWRAPGDRQYTRERFRALMGGMRDRFR
jgi:serine/threonine-protein kinase